MVNPNENVSYFRQEDNSSKTAITIHTVDHEAMHGEAMQANLSRASKPEPCRQACGAELLY